MSRPSRYFAATARGLCFVSLIALAGCGDEPERETQGQAVAEAPLPGPQQAGGAVTDMPAAPGPGEVPLAGSASPQPPATTPGDASGLPPLEQNPEAGLVAPVALEPLVTTPVATPPPADPRDVLRDYYAAINAREFATAHATWSGNGTGAAASPAQLAASFADAASIELTVGEPRPAEGAAGSVYVEVPVTVTRTGVDGSVQHQAGRYTLRRSQVDGATAAQRDWRIAAVDLRDAAR